MFGIVDNKVIADKLLNEENLSSDEVANVLISIASLTPITSNQYSFRKESINGFYRLCLDLFNSFKSHLTDDEKNNIACDLGDHHQPIEDIINQIIDLGNHRFQPSQDLKILRYFEDKNLIKSNLKIINEKLSTHKSIVYKLFVSQAFNDNAKKTVFNFDKNAIFLKHKSLTTVVYRDDNLSMDIMFLNEHDNFYFLLRNPDNLNDNILSISGYKNFRRFRDILKNFVMDYEQTNVEILIPNDNNAWFAKRGENEYEFAMGRKLTNVSSDYVNNLIIMMDKLLYESSLSNDLNLMYGVL